MKAWRDFKAGIWQEKINVRDFIQKNHEPYYGDDSFLEGASDRTKKLLNEFRKLQKLEMEKGVVDMETKIPSTITAYGPGYVDRENEVIVGLQTDKPLKRAFMPFGIRLRPRQRKPTDMKSILSWSISLRNSVRPTTRACSTFIRKKCVWQEKWESLPGFRTDTEGEESSAITGEFLCTASTA